MNQQKIGVFLKELRKEKNLTQEQMAEYLNVSRRTISRWETARNMPDLDLLIELSDYYEVELKELLDGERKSEKMNKDLEETVLKVADYSNDEKIRLMKTLHFLAWVGVISFIIGVVLQAMGLTETTVVKNIAHFCLGLSFAMLINAVLYTSKIIFKIKSFKKRIFIRK